MALTPGFVYPTKGWRKLLADLFMGPDGETWAIGRLYSVPVLLVGLAIPIIALFRDQKIEMVDVGVLLTGIGGACLLLIRGANLVDLELPELPTSKKD